MDPQPALPADPTPAPPPIARQAAIVEELAEVALLVAKAIGRRVIAAADAADAADAAESGDAETTPTPPVGKPVLSNAAGGVEGPPVFTGDPALAFARASRAVRMSVALWSQLTREMQAQADGAAARAQQDRQAEAAVRQARAERIVERIAEQHFEVELPGKENDDEAGERVERVMREACERLGDDDLYGDLVDRPFSEIIARICADLGLSPDWPQLAEEYWAQAEIAGGAAFPPGQAAPAEPSRAPGRPRREAAAPTGRIPGLVVRFVEPEPPEPVLSDAAGGPHPEAPDPEPPDPELPHPELVEGQGRGPQVEPVPAPPPPRSPELDAEARAAAVRAERLAFAEYGPRGQGRPPDLSWP